MVGLLLGQLDRPKEPEQTAAHVQRLWLDGSMTNFDYLTSLSKLAGRSFNDQMQYPVFPFVLRDYDSETLDLESPDSFRYSMFVLFLLLPVVPVPCSGIATGE